METVILARVSNVTYCDVSNIWCCCRWHRCCWWFLVNIGCRSQK